MSFELLLAEHRVKPHQITALHLIVAFILLGCGGLLLMTNLTMIVADAEGGTDSNIAPFFKSAGWTMLICGLLLFILTAFRNKWLTKPANNLIFRALELLLMIGAVIFSGMHKLWVPGTMAAILAVVLAMAAIWENGRKSKLSVIIDERGIRIPASLKKSFIHWAETEQVLLRHSVLTVNCYDNRMYQWNVRPTGIDNEDFEAFCSSQIELNKDKKDAYNW